MFQSLYHSLSCKKCGKTFPVASHKYCVFCGAKYPTIEVNLANISDMPLFKKARELLILYSTGKETKYGYLVSEEAVNVMMNLATAFIPAALDELLSDGKTNEHEKWCWDKPLSSLFWTCVLQGYFVWFAEHFLADKTINPSHAPDSEEFKKDFFKTYSIIQKDVGEHLTDLQYNNGISKDTAIVLYGLVELQKFEEEYLLIPYKSVFSQVRQVCLNGSIGGYAVALTDAKYRK